jgi:HEAT repeat protein
MGLFDFLGRKNGKPEAARSKSEREIARLSRVVENKMSQNFDRSEAIEQLSKLGTASAAAALLRRFNFTMDPSITDQEEKEAAASGIVTAGDAALEPLREYCKRAESLTWPLRILRDIVPGEELADELLGLLDQFNTEYVRNPEPKIQLINELAEFRTEDVRVAIEPFLDDASEPVRFAAASTLLSVGFEESVAALAAQLGAEESLRVRNRIAQGLAERRWAIPKELIEGCASALPEDFSLRDGQVFAR